MDARRKGRCNCGAVTFEVRGAPMRVGLCHCQTCRRETGSAFIAFAVWRKDQVTIAGPTSNWMATTDRRHFCPTCGSSVFATHDGDDEIEIRIGCLDDAPSGLAPQYELWTPRRESWLPTIPNALQFPKNRKA